MLTRFVGPLRLALNVIAKLAGSAFGHQNLTVNIGVRPPTPKEKLPEFACLLFIRDTEGL